MYVTYVAIETAASVTQVLTFTMFGMKPTDGGAPNGRVIKVGIVG